MELLLQLKPNWPYVAGLPQYEDAAGVEVVLAAFGHKHSSVVGTVDLEAFDNDTAGYTAAQDTIAVDYILDARALVLHSFDDADDAHNAHHSIAAAVVAAAAEDAADTFDADPDLEGECVLDACHGPSHFGQEQT